MKQRSERERSGEWSEEERYEGTETGHKTEEEEGWQNEKETAEKSKSRATKVR